MNVDNPYATPAHTGGHTGGYPGADSSGDYGRITSPMLTALRETRPWVRLVAVAGFVGAALLVLGGVVVALAGGLGGMMGGDAMAGGMGFGIGLLYVVLGAIYILPSLYLWRYSRAIGSLLEGGRAPALEEALVHQRSFWRLVGILVLVMIGLYAVGIVLAVVFAGLSAGG